MALFRKFFYRKPPDGLLEISERVYVFDCCFATDVWEDNEYKIYIGGIVHQLRDQFPEASYMVFNFREGEYQSLIESILSEFDMTVIDYPRQYEGCPLLTMEMVHHFLKSSESWLSLGQQNVILMHCEQGGWPVLAFMLASLLIFRKQFTGEQKTLDMIYKQAPRELLHLMSPLNPIPSQLRYLQYVSRRKVVSQWPPSDRALTLDCIILRFIPDMDGEGGCRPVFRIYGPDPFIATDRAPKVLFSTPKRSKLVRYYKQVDCELVKIDIHCHVLGDVVLECISLDTDQERETMMFRIMFNTAFIRSNILMLNRDEIDILWNAKDQFPKDFRAEVIFSDMDVATSFTSIDLPGIEEKDGLPMEAFAKVQKIFSNVDWQSPKKNVANMLQHLAVSNILQENFETSSPNGMQRGSVLHDIEVKEKAKLKESKHIISGPTSAALEKQSTFSFESSLVTESTREKIELQEIQVTSQNYAEPTPSFGPSSDPNPMERKTELQELQVAPQEAEYFETSMKTYSEANSIGKKVETQELQVGLQQPAKSTSSFKPILDINPITKKIEPEELQVSIQRPALPKIISQRIPQSSISSPVSCSNSLQGSPVPISRYHSEPSALGITALLHDHGVSKSGEHIHPVTSPLSSLAISSPLSNKPKPPQLSVAITSPNPPPSTTKSPQPSSLTASPVPTVNNSFQSVPPPPPPPPPAPPFSGTYPSSTVRNSFSAPPRPPPLPSATSSSSVTCLNSSPQQLLISGPPPPPPPPPPLHYGSVSDPTSKSAVPQPSPLPSCSQKGPNNSIPCSDSQNPSFLEASPSPAAKNSFQSPPSPPPPPPPPSFSGKSKSPSSSSASPVPTVNNLSQSPLPLPPPSAAPFSGICPSSTVKNSFSAPPHPPPLPTATSSSSVTYSNSSPQQLQTSGPPPPPPPPLHSGSVSDPTSKSALPQPPLPPSLAPKGPSSNNSAHVPPVPPPPAPCAKELSKACGTSPQSHSASNGNIPSIPGPPSGAPLNLKGRGISHSGPKNQAQTRKSNLKPYHWLKLTRAMQGSLWADAQKPEEASEAPEIDMSELETLFSAAVANSDNSGRDGRSNRRASGCKPEKVQLVELRRAYNCEIMLTKVKVPLPDLMSSVLSLDDTALDADQLENLIKFCPTKEEMELLKGYKGDKENLGKCEQFFLELMKVPRIESKLRVFLFKIQFCSQVRDLRNSLNVVNSAAEEVRNSVRLKRIMQTILSLGNALNHGTARGSAVGFRLDSLLKLTDTRARNNKMTLMHYLCKVLVKKLPELLDFPKDLVTLEASTKIQLKYLAEEMQAISKGLEKVVQELAASENDGPVSETFCKTLKEFLSSAESEVRSLASLYSSVGRNADALAFYFGEDPARCPFEQVVSTLLNFVRMFIRAHEENCKQLELEKKKAQKEAENEKLKITTAAKESERLIQSPIMSNNIQ
ncbi:hypothetical protein PTKIN_Ptkin19aG0127100 [Pterospermum kingtungense]